ncbi:MAG: hypothetical protein CML56_01870 [Rhodobacteraceae bacterium]|nr:hypothetical protein [Paracoccaceae bacterium]
MQYSFDAKELLLKHLLVTKEIESRDEFLGMARKYFYIDDRGEVTTRGNILATVVKSDPSLLSSH